ncbi:hypothetical protein DIJ64_03580 [Mycobacterium leprae]|uniref:Uncharacterized protein n=1 Tax=Mycobacterium leprae TaxID=1769 RepID=A0AAD0P4K8_MYCLR|nr:hypothetical protein DIJ64_03580 [Mycobacterium leprae]OAR21690.1 hypothetical protein A8144_00290 [Mycobacterium leprae 3125609]OAX72228.1 hypothetical protein A3216_00350 [Mycobacterium leprae 7935681]
MTSGRGADVVVEPVGDDRMTDSLHSLALGRQLITNGFAGGEIPKVKVKMLLLNNIDVSQYWLEYVDPNAPRSPV